MRAPEGGAPVLLAHARQEQDLRAQSLRAPSAWLCLIFRPLTLTRLNLIPCKLTTRDPSRRSLKLAARKLLLRNHVRAGAPPRCWCSAPSASR
jgi:hypothetical protein